MTTDKQLTDGIQWLERQMANANARMATDRRLYNMIAGQRDDLLAEQRRRDSAARHAKEKGLVVGDETQERCGCANPRCDRYNIDLRIDGVRFATITGTDCGEPSIHFDNHAKHLPLVAHPFTVPIMQLAMEGLTPEQLIAWVLDAYAATMGDNGE